MATSRRKSILSNRSSGSSSKKSVRLGRRNSNATFRSSLGSIYDRYGSPGATEESEDDVEDGFKIVHFIYSDSVVQALKQLGVFIHIIHTPDPRFRNKRKPKSSRDIQICKLPQIYSEVKRQVGSREYVIRPREKSQRGSRGSLGNAGYYSSDNSPNVGLNKTKDYSLPQTFRAKLEMSRQGMDKRKPSFIPDKKKGLLKLPPIKATKR